MAFFGIIYTVQKLMARAFVRVFLFIKPQNKPKEYIMAKVTYTADGRAKVFHFDFPFFNRADVMVAVNGNTAPTGIAIQTGRPSDTDTFPYTGGAVHFATAPRTGAYIEIWRDMRMTRPCDYQDLCQPTPHELNRDFNFNLENMKDFRDRLAEFDNSYANILNISDMPQLIVKIEQLTAAIENFGDIGVIETTIDTIQGDIDELSGRVDTLSARPVVDPSTITALQEEVTRLSARLDAIAGVPANLP